MPDINVSSVSAVSSLLPEVSSPPRLPAPLLLVGMAAVLAGLDMAGAIAAKAWAEHRSAVWFVVGLMLFGLLFWVYGSALRFAELAEVTVAWIVLLQVALLVIDRFYYGVDVAASKWLAVAIILSLEAFIILVPDAAVA
jgi:hypothetical protein